MEKTGTICALQYYAILLEDMDCHPISSSDGTDLNHLLWMCNHCLDNIDTYYIAKISRWLGFIQGCLIMCGITTVIAERNRTSPWFTGKGV